MLCAHCIYLSVGILCQLRSLVAQRRSALCLRDLFVDRLDTPSSRTGTSRIDELRSGECMEGGHRVKHFIFAVFCATASLFGADGLVVTSGVTFSAHLPENGGIASAFLSGLNVSGVVAAQSVPLPLSLAGVTVDVCGASAPLYAIADLGGYQQINFQVPWESQFIFDGTVDYYRCVVTVRQGGFQATQNAYVWFVAADVFFTPDFVGIMQHGADYSLVTRSHPAVPGEAVVLYAAALPQTSPPVLTGAAAPYSPLAVVPEPNLSFLWIEIDVVIDSLSVHPSFVGLVPGQVGLYQLNFRVPETISAGDHSLKIVIGECKAINGDGCRGPEGPFSSSNSVVLPVGTP